jgi:hypothetical protein
MAVVGYREVVPRTFSHRLGESPTAERKFVVTLDTPNTPHQVVINTVGVGHGSAHPEYNFLRMTDASLSENSGTPYHVEVTCRYELLKQDYEPNPLNRADVWSFSTGGASVPAIAYYDGNTQKPLINAAGDFFEGATTEESEVRATISANRASFPLGLAAYVTNTLNSDFFLGGQPFTWKCAGIGGQQAVEMVNDVEVRYWQITSELVYRASGWPLLLPHVGFNVIEDGQKRRAWVRWKDEDGIVVRVPAANAVALNNDGSIRERSAPDVLTRRVHRISSFSTYFGEPTF